MATVTKKQKKGSALSITPNANLPLAMALSSDVDKNSVDKNNVDKNNVDKNNVDEETIFYPPSEDGLQVSEETYWADYYEHPNFNYEWNNGILEEKGMSDRYTYLTYMWLTQLIIEYLKHNPIAQTTSLETGGRIFLPHKTAIRKPDFGIVLNTNPVPYQGNDKSYQGTFDICIEAISKSKNVHKTRDTVYKKEEYALGGVKEYYILDGKEEETAFYYLNEQGEYEEIKSEDGVIHSKVLPGFQFRISDLYQRPPIDQLVYDEVYKHFVDRRFQAEAKARQQEAKARQQEAKARQQEAKARQQEAKARQQAEAEIERLKALLETVNKQS